MSVSTWVNPYEPVAPVLAIAADWAAQGEAERTELGLVLSQLPQRADWRLSIHRTPGGVQAVSVVLAGGDWYLEASDETAALILANPAVVHGRIPATLTTSAPVWDWLRPHLSATGHLVQEEHLLTLGCTRVGGPGEGRWAAPGDLEALRKFESEMKSDSPSFPHTAWEIVIAFRQLAILEVDGAVAAALQRFGKTAASAGIASLYATPRLRGTGLESKLVNFVVGELLSESPAVQVSVGQAEAAELEFYRALGFETVRSRFRARFAG